VRHGGLETVWRKITVSKMKLTNVNGELCICMVSDPWDKPEYRATHFPTGVNVRDFIKTFGDPESYEVHHDGSTYCICPKGGPLKSRYTQLNLKDGGKTRPVKSEKFQIPQPKVRVGIQVRWNENRHRWEKLLKTGWKEIY
jgi:hypothetical protein